MKTLLLATLLLGTLISRTAAADASGQYVAVGTGRHYYDTAALGRPFGNDPQRYQLLALQDELQAAEGEKIIGIAFDGVLDPLDKATFTNVEIHLCHTSQEKLDPTFADNYDGETPARVFHRAELIVNWVEKGWHELVFDEPFAYDGENHLVIEIRHEGGDGTLKTTRWSCPPGRILDGVGKDNQGPTAVTGHLRNYFNGLRVYFERAGDAAE